MGKNKLQRFNFINPISQVDRSKGIIHGVSVITGDVEAKGHGQFIDATTLDQVAKFGQESGDVGIKARFDHPNACGSSMGTAIGRFKNFRREDNQVKADLHLLDSSKISPNGNYHEYILALAEEDPKAFATSIVFRPDEPFMPEESEEESAMSATNPDGFPHVRVASLTHVDVVDEPAANPNGLFGNPAYIAEQAESFLRENYEDIVKPLIKKYMSEELKKEEVVADFEPTTKNIELAADEATKSVLDQMEADLKESFTKVDELSTKLEESEKSLTELSETVVKYKELTEAHEALQSENEALKTQLAEALETPLGNELAEGSTPDVQKISKPEPETAFDKELKRQAVIMSSIKNARK